MSQCVLHPVCVQVEVSQGLVSDNIAHLLQAASEVLSQGSHSYTFYLSVHDDGASSQALYKKMYIINGLTLHRSSNLEIMFTMAQETLELFKLNTVCMYSIKHKCRTYARLFSSRLLPEGINYLSPKPQLPCQVVMANLLRELDTEVSVCPVVGDTFIHDLIDNVQHVVLRMSIRVTENKIEQTSWRA